jgi:integrase/recombinase XerC
MTGEGEDDPGAHHPAAPDALRAFEAWLGFLAKERGYSRNTLGAYERDIRQFFVFLRAHLGRPTSLGDLNRLTPQDMRAFMALRRSIGTCSRSLSRSISALRSFFRFLERAELLKNRSVLAVALPKVPFSIPRPLTVSKTDDLLAESSAADRRGQPKWTGARDNAALLLLYGAGLRISEALNLARRDAPVPPSDILRVTGKGASRRARLSASEIRSPAP